MSYLPQYVRGLLDVETETVRKALDEIEQYSQDPPRLLSVDDLVELGEAPNVWKHDKKLNVLTYTPERWGAPYEIDLDDKRLKTPAGELGWIRHIAEKNWADSPCVLADLVKAFEKLLDNPRD